VINPPNILYLPTKSRRGFRPEQPGSDTACFLLALPQGGAFLMHHYNGAF